MDRKNLTLFSASFKESTRIVPNFFTTSNFNDLGTSGSQNIYQRIFSFFIAMPFATIIPYALGVGLPEIEKSSPSKNIDLHFVNESIFHSISYFTFLKPIIIGIIIILILTMLLNIFPKKNYPTVRLFEISILFLLILIVSLSLAPLLLGLSLGASGWLGFFIINVYGVIFLLSRIIIKKNSLKAKMYNKIFDNDDSKIIKFWLVIKKYWYISLVVLLLNITIFRFGMWGPRSIWSIWSILGIVYYLIVSGFVYSTLNIYMSTFYFIKYSEQYKEKWKPTNEQWYGKRKAKKLAKYNKKKEEE